MAIFKYTIESCSFPEGDGGDPGNCIQEIDGEIFELAKDSDNQTKVGKIKAYRLNLSYALNNNIPWFDVFDCHSDSIYRYYEALIDDETGDYLDSLLDDHGEPNDIDLLIIDRIEIIPKYRGSNIGIVAIKDLVKNFGLTCAYVVLESYPLQFEADYLENKKAHKDLELEMFSQDFQKAEQQLSNYYKGAGFKKIQGTNCMILNPGKTAV